MNTATNPSSSWHIMVPAAGQKYLFLVFEGKKNRNWVILLGKTLIKLITFVICLKLFEARREKTGFLHMRKNKDADNQLISAFVFAT